MRPVRLGQGAGCHGTGVGTILMELRDLEYFLAVVDTGSMTLAARQKGLSQQALSKSLARLEDELGVMLLERTPKGVRLTRMGEALLTRARSILGEMGQFRRDLDVALGRSSTQLALGVSPAAAAGIGRQAIPRLQRLFPRLHLRVEAGVEPSFTRMLLAGEIDLAVTTSAAVSDAQIVTTELGQERWVVAGRQGHPLLSGAESLADLAAGDWIYGPMPDGLDQRIDRHFAEKGVAPIKPRITSSSILFGLSILIGTDLLAILPRSMVGGATGLMGRDLADGAWMTPLIVMRRRRAAASTFETSLIDILTEESRRLNAAI